MRPSGRTLALGALAFVTLLALGGCRRRPAPTVAVAYQRLQKALQARSATGLYDALDQQSQWSVISIQKYYRQIRDLVQRTYPPAARARELERTAGAEAERPEDFFAALATRRGWLKRFPSGTEPLGLIETGGERALAHPDKGAPLTFAHTAEGGWGFAGLQAELEELKRRASQDLAMARENAAIYQHAGPPAAAPGGAGGGTGAAREGAGAAP